MDGTRSDADGEGPAQVLLVEDDDLLRRMLLRLLGSWSFAVHEAADGRAALRLVAERVERLDAVVLDIMLPHVNGVEVARAIRAARPHLPIVACSAAFEPTITAELARLRVDWLLPKPFPAEKLRSLLEAALHRPIAVAEPVGPSPGDDAA